MADHVAPRGLNLPTSNDIRFEDIDRVCRVIQRFASDARLIQAHMEDQSPEALNPL